MTIKTPTLYIVIQYNLTKLTVHFPSKVIKVLKGELAYKPFYEHYGPLLPSVL